MRKYIIGGLVGAALMLSFNVSAAVESLIGKEVQGEVGVKLNGASLDNKAAIVDGSSYLPVRAIGEALGLNVDFQNNEVVINQKQSEVKPLVTEQPTITPDATPQPIMTVEEKAKKIEGIDNMIKSKNENISRNQILLNDYKKITAMNNAIKPLEDAIQRDKDEIADLENQKVELQK